MLSERVAFAAARNLSLSPLSHPKASVVNRALCEYFGGSYRKRGGQFYDGVRAVFDGVSCPHVFGEERGFPALGEIAAHEAQDFVASAFRANLVKLVQVPVVKGIVFANYGTYFHFFTAFSLLFIL